MNVPLLATGELADRDAFRRDVLAGLGGSPRAIPAKYLYDARGSALFDAICEQPEYYPTHTEAAILRECAGEIARLAGPGCALVEYGSGSSVKTRLLLEAVQFQAPDFLHEPHPTTRTAKAAPLQPRQVDPFDKDLHVHDAVELARLQRR